MQTPDFPPIDPGEINDYSYDFSRELIAGETISSVEWTFSAALGTDTDPASRLISVTREGSLVTQRVGNCLPGVRYVLQAKATTNIGRVCSIWAYLPCSTLR